jgi:hypothetical protein
MHHLLSFIFKKGKKKKSRIINGITSTGVIMLLGSSRLSVEPSPFAIWTLSEEQKVTEEADPRNRKENGE